MKRLSGRKFPIALAQRNRAAAPKAGGRWFTLRSDGYAQRGKFSERSMKRFFCGALAHVLLDVILDAPEPMSLREHGATKRPVRPSCFKAAGRATAL